MIIYVFIIYLYKQINIYIDMNLGLSKLSLHCKHDVAQSFSAYSRQELHRDAWQLMLST